MFLLHSRKEAQRGISNVVLNRAALFVDRASHF